MNLETGRRTSDRFLLHKQKLKPKTVFRLLFVCLFSVFFLFCSIFFLDNLGYFAGGDLRHCRGLLGLDELRLRGQQPPRRLRLQPVQGSTTKSDSYIFKQNASCTFSNDSFAGRHLSGLGGSEKCTRRTLDG